jgi:hypothetical protein
MQFPTLRNSHPRVAGTYLVDNVRCVRWIGHMDATTKGIYERSVLVRTNSNIIQILQNASFLALNELGHTKNQAEELWVSILIAQR